MTIGSFFNFYDTGSGRAGWESGMADLSVMTVRGESQWLIGEGTAAELLCHEGADDLIKSGIYLFLRNVIRDLDIEHNLDVFHKSTDSLLIA